MKTNEKKSKLKSNFVGRRTGIDIKAGKTIRKHEDGTDVFDDYWTDSDEEIHLSVQEPQYSQVDSISKSPKKLNDDGITKLTQKPTILEVTEDKAVYTEVIPEKNRFHAGSSSKPKIQVKKKNKSNVIKNSNKDLSAARRSTRNRIAPLEYWRNERVRYQFTASGDIKVLGLEKGETDKSLWSEKFQNQYYRNKKTMKRSYKKDDDIIEMNEFLENGIMVLDPETREEVSADLVRTYKSLTWKTSKGSVSTNPKSFAISKSFQCDKLATGFLKLPAMEEKPIQYLPSDDVIFTIMHGKVQVLIHETVLKLQNNDTFIVPQGNPYSIKNIAQEEALLSFLTIKETLLEQLSNSKRFEYN